MDKTEELRDEITRRLQRALTPVSSLAVNAMVELIEAHTQAAVQKAEGIGQYIAASKLSMYVGYLLAHKRQGLPEMTSKVIDELWNEIKRIEADNNKYMRPITPTKEPE